jgi:hypothetical protein
MGRYSKNLSGQKGYVFVGPANVEYTDSTTYAGFVTEAAEGEIGVFLAAGTVKTTALAAGEEFFIAQMRDGFVQKTPIIKYNEVYSRRKTAYSAPVRKVVTVGYAGSGSGDISLDFTGASVTNPIEFGISVRETTPGNQPFPIQEAYHTVTSSTYDEYTAVAALVTQLNMDTDYQKAYPDSFIKAEILANGALTELTQNLTVVNGSKIITAAGSITIATGAFVSIRGTVYKVAVGGTGTSFTLDRPFQGTSETIVVASTVDQAATMAYTSGTTLLGIRLTGLRDEVHFVVAVHDNIYAAPIATATEWVQGSGSGESIVELEKEGRFFTGIGSVVNAEFASDYGLPTLFASATGTYDQYFVDVQTILKPSAAAPLSENRSIERVHIAVPSSGTTPSNELTTILGV